MTSQLWKKSVRMIRDFGVMYVTLKGNAGRFIFHINNTAFPESVFFQQMAHDSVLFMGINPQIGSKSTAELQAVFQNTFLSAAACNPMTP